MQIVAALKGRIDNGKSQNALAEELGLSAAHLSNIMGGAFEKVSTKVWARLFEETGMRLPRIETTNFTAIQELCSTAQRRCRMVAISAGTGLGKTTALRHYATRTEGAHYMFASKSQNHHEFVRAMAESIGAARGGKLHTTIMNITQVLHERPGSLIIVDDAGKIWSKTLAVLQEIRDRNMDTGFVLAGTPSFKRYMRQGVEADWPGFAEMDRRIGFWMDLHKPDQADVKALASYAGITDPKALKYIHNLSTNYGVLTELLENAILAFSAGNDPNRVDVLRALQVGDAQLS